MTFPPATGATGGAPLVFGVASQSCAGPSFALEPPDLPVGHVAGLALVRSRSEVSDPVTVLRQLDLVVLAIALPVFLAAGFPLAGYAVGAGAWLVQKLVKHVLERRAAASDDPRTVVGLAAGSMIARGWFVAIAIFLVGLSSNRAGLSAAVLVIALFTVYFTTSMILRPFDVAREGDGQ